ncbi:tRNA threonylcarbamoyladenosine dehydratase [Miniphocaeibacter massiliensis]|uniref:tRNA threonylcarbamoyladenosine dehydratase n=1 Tax=Miniphocaeibacter massiliensis TaxID=2041841 RepID=UPI000C06C79E|nr:tRNA threonylcarbamoyladenosine dehydratase [Miniphocaeibacter massiliensis]
MERKFLQRTELLIGKSSISTLLNSKVIVFGVGGVGGYTVEALVRSGIENISIVDYDTVDITNLNRQIIALNSTVGKYKVDIFKERIKDINPLCKVKIFKKKLVPKNIEEFSLKEYDYVVDAIDNITSKIALINYCYNNNINIISSMGAGNKLDPTRFKVSDINKTKECPMARVIRTKLKKIGVKKLKVVWSDEKTSGSTMRNEELGKSSPSSIAFIPSVAGLIIAGEVVKDLYTRGD